MTLPAACIVLILTDLRSGTLNALCAMPGWSAAAEVMQRGEHCVCTASEAGNTIAAFLSSLAQLRGVTNTRTLGASISMAATVRKLVWPYLQCETGKVRDARRGGWVTADVERRRWCDERKQDLRLMIVGNLFPSMVNAVVTLDRSHATSNAGDRSNGIGSNVGGGEAINSQPNFDDGREDGRDTLPLYHSSSVLVHQLEAVCLVTLAQICHLRLECEDTGCSSPGNYPEWYKYVVNMCGFLQNPELKVFAASLLAQSSAVAAGSQWRNSEVCERYAVSHFQGRLLPGCCNLGCTTLGGPSEAALETRLCSGCKMARYCSVKCQKEAWREGAHSSVCGK